MSHYAAGTRFEHKTIHDLEENGYVIIRAAGSKGGSKVDIAAMKPGQLLFIQCKRSGALGPAEWDRVVEVAGWVGAIPLLAANGPNGRGVVYTRLLGPKVPRARTQPCEPFLLDEIADAPRVVTCQYDPKPHPLDDECTNVTDVRPVVARYDGTRHDDIEDIALPGLEAVK